jgi:hypothetical protein
MTAGPKYVTLRVSLYRACFNSFFLFRVTYFWADGKKKEKPQNLPAPEVFDIQTFLIDCILIPYTVHREIGCLDFGATGRSGNFSRKFVW